MFTKVTLAVTILASIFLPINSHMVLNYPNRFMGPDNANWTPFNSPLDTQFQSTSNYPCKVSPTYDAYSGAPPRTVMPLGSKQTVNFTGEAVHGGGSCQFSLSKDLKPDAKSEFKVIHSVQGGCPARNTAGNLGGDDDASAADPFQYAFTMPTNIPPGEYTFAWTWFNKVGNREMYMSCAPVTVTAAGSARKVKRADAEAAFTGLPDMFIANVPDVKCAVPDNVDLRFPNPGASVENNVQSLGPPTGPVDECYAPLMKDMSGASNKWSGYGPQGGSVHYHSPPKPQPAPYSPPSTSTPAPSPPDTYAPTSTAVATPAPAPPTTYTPTPQPPSSGGSTPPQPPTPYSGGGGQCASGNVSCPTPGSVVCVGKSSWGLCGMDNCAFIQPLALGTSCRNGKISKRGLPTLRKGRKRGMLRRDAKYL